MVLDFVNMTNKELTTFLLSRHKNVNRYKAQFLIAVAAFEVRGLAPDYGAATTAAYLQRKLDISESTSYEYVRYGVRLSKFQHIMNEAVNGTLPYGKLRLILNYAREGDEEWELKLLKMASDMRIEELRQTLAGLGREPNKQPKPDTFRVWVDEDTGRIRLYGDFTPATGAKVLAALKIGELANLVDLDEVDEEVFADDAAVTERLREAEAQDSFDDEVNQEIEDPEPSGTRPVSGFGPPLRNAMLSAFLGMINVMRTRPTNSLRSPAAQVNLLMYEDGFSCLPAQPGAPSSSLAAEIINGEIRAHLLSTKGLVLHVGHKRRLVTDSQIKSLMVSWNGTCAGPGCNHRRFLQFHHIHPWNQGGKTNEWNIVPLCSECHSLISDGLVTLEPVGEGNAVLKFGYPDGTTHLVRNRHAAIRVGEHLASVA